MDQPTTDTQTNVRALFIGSQMGWHGGNSIPMALVGAPGTGKSEIILQMGDLYRARVREMGLAEDYVVSHLVGPQMLPEDVAGIGHINSEAKALERWPLLGIRSLANAKYGISFFDELTATSQAVGGATMTAIQSRLYGDTLLPSTISAIAAWNPPECAAGGRDLSWPEINRFCVLKWTLSNKDYLDYLMGGPGALAHAVYLPADWWAESKRFRARILVKSFLQVNPQFINTLDSGEATPADAGNPWASQRAWSNVTRALGAVFSLGLDANGDEASVLVRGLVGDGVGRAFIGHCRDMDLPNPEDLLDAAMRGSAKESKADRTERLLGLIPSSVSKRSDKLKVCLESVANAAIAPHENKLDRWTAGWAIVGPFLQAKPDIALDAAQSLVGACPAGSDTARDEILAVFKILNATSAIPQHSR